MFVLINHAYITLIIPITCLILTAGVFKGYSRFCAGLLTLFSTLDIAFWIANLTELFERLSYYAQSAVLAIFLHESLHLSAQQTGGLIERVPGQSRSVRLLVSREEIPDLE